MKTGRELEGMIRIPRYDVTDDSDLCRNLQLLHAITALPVVGDVRRCAGVRTVVLTPRRRGLPSEPPLPFDAAPAPAALPPVGFNRWALLR